MANNGNKKIIVKKDMNFFAEFTASAAKAARLLTYAVLFGIAVVGIILVFIVIGIVRNTIIKGQIADLEAQLASDEYANLEVQASALAETLKTKNNYFYALCQMRKNVDETPAVSMDLPDVIADDIPSDSYLIQYQITGTTLAMEGYSFSYYSPVDMVNILQASKVFTSRPKFLVERVDGTTLGTPSEFYNSKTGDAVMLNNYYSFSIEGTLISKVYISIGRFLNGATISSLSGVETTEFAAGSEYNFTEGIDTFKTGGVTYNLVKITVNGTDVDAESLAKIRASHALSGTAKANAEINLYYEVAVAQTAASQPAA
jgi:hypothetical protein